MSETTWPFFFTWQAQAEARPLEITGGKGVWFDTADGARWLDMAALVYQVNAGHGVERIVEAVRRQASTLCVASPNAVFPAKVALAERLLALAPPGFTKVFFTLGGAEANENALKLARMVTGRHKTISRYRSYHGASLGALGLTGDYRRPPLEPLLSGAVHALDCYCERCPFGLRYPACGVRCADHIGDLLELEGAGTIGAVVLEPVPGANGVLVPPPEYWPKVRAACERDGALLIADCVLTGFGRTGVWFGFEHWDVVPDMITLAKGLTGGYAPMGAVLVHERIARHFEERTLYAGLTSYAHPLGCAAALETLAVYEDEDLIGNAARLEPQLRGELEALRAAFPQAVFSVRAQGLLGALELTVDAAQWRRLNDALEARHVLVHPRGRERTVIVSPPLCITPEELREGMQRIGAALGEALA